MSHRTQQIESTLQRAIAEVLQRRISDPRIHGLISITRIEVSPDLREASVYVSVLPEQNQKKVLLGLRHAAGHIQSLVLKQMAIKAVPHLDFRLDDSLKKSAGIFEAIQRGVERESPTSEVQSPKSADEAEDPPGNPDAT